MNAKLYYLGLAFLFTHELDAVTHSEWQLLPLLKGMSGAAAASTFIVSHVPLFFLILLLSHHENNTVQRTSRAVIASLLVLHAVLHLCVTSIPGYGFNGLLSQTLILSAGGFGLAYLLIQRQQRNHTASSPGQVD